MSTSSKTPASIRQGGPGASHENAKRDAAKPPADVSRRQHSGVSGGGGEHDSHQAHSPRKKGGGV